MMLRADGHGFEIAAFLADSVLCVVMGFPAGWDFPDVAVFRVTVGIAGATRKTADPFKVLP